MRNCPLKNVTECVNSNHSHDALFNINSPWIHALYITSASYSQADLTNMKFITLAVACTSASLVAAAVPSVNYDVVYPTPSHAPENYDKKNETEHYGKKEKKDEKKYKPEYYDESNEHEKEYKKKPVVTKTVTEIKKVPKTTTETKPVPTTVIEISKVPSTTTETKPVPTTVTDIKKVVKTETVTEIKTVTEEKKPYPTPDKKYN